MYCPNCSRRVFLEGKFCPRCGEKLRERKNDAVKKQDRKERESNSSLNRNKEIVLEKKKKIMLGYISKYLLNRKNKAYSHVLNILEFRKAQHVKAFFDEHSLERVRRWAFQYRPSYLSVKTLERALDFLEKTYKLLKKKGIETDYFEILSVFAEVIENNRKKYDKISIPVHRKKIMLSYISKYVQTRAKISLGYILALCKSKYIDGHSLERLRYQVAEEFTIDPYEEKLGFLEDLEKLYKLFKKKGIETNYFEILSLFEEVIENGLNKERDKFLIPAYKGISKRLGKNVSKKRVVEEFMKIPYMKEFLMDHAYDVHFQVSYTYFWVSRLLDKFDLEYEQDEVEKLIEIIKEEADLEEFERNLGSSQKICIGDFRKLKGSEFEEYLKNLFGLLGYTVIKTSLSRDQGADLIISKDGEKVVVQAKKYEGKVSNKAVQEIVAAKNYYKANKAMVVTNSSFTKSAIDLALANHVELWDGKKLKNVIENLTTKNERKEKDHFIGFLKKGKNKTLKSGGRVQCRFCGREFDYEVNIGKAGIRKGLTFEVKCPDCGSQLKITNVSIQCKYCSKQFDALSEVKKHEKTCKKEIIDNIHPP